MNRPKLLLDQMIDALVATALDQQGWDVVRVSELGLATADVILCHPMPSYVLVLLKRYNLPLNGTIY